MSTLPKATTVEGRGSSCPGWRLKDRFSAKVDVSPTRDMRRLLTVEDHFQITGRGLLIAPAPLISEFVGPCSIDVEVRLPDGRRRNAKLVLQIALQTPSPPVAERRYAALFRDLSKDDVPIGSELWCSEAG